MYVALFQPFEIKCVVYIQLTEVVCRLSLNNIRGREIPLLFIFILWNTNYPNCRSSCTKNSKIAVFN